MSAHIEQKRAGVGPGCASQRDNGSPTSAACVRAHQFEEGSVEPPDCPFRSAMTIPSESVSISASRGTTCSCPDSCSTARAGEIAE